MREIDIRAVQAARDERTLDDFTLEYDGFVIRCASKAAGKYISKSDDEYSVALCAFAQAIRDYSYDKGAFLSFAELVVRRRLADYFRQENRRKNEIPIDPADFSSEPDADDEGSAALKIEVTEKLSCTPDDSLKMEIEDVTERLSCYGFSFYDLISCSPKAEKTKAACAKAINYVIKTPILKNELNDKKMLQIKIIEKNTGVPRKILERHRKYIIAAVEILTGDYPNLAEYLRFVREGC